MAVGAGVTVTAGAAVAAGRRVFVGARVGAGAGVAVAATATGASTVPLPLQAVRVIKASTGITKAAKRRLNLNRAILSCVLICRPI